MKTSKYSVSFPVTELGQISVEKVINEFHKWVKEQQPSQLHLDVADYSHVPDGPGILLVGFHEIIAFRLNAVEPELVITQKSPLEGEDACNLVHCLENACRYAKQFVQAFASDISIDTQNFYVGLNDRLQENDVVLNQLADNLKKIDQKINLGWETSQLNDRNPKSLPRLKITAKTNRNIDELSQHLTKSVAAAISAGK